MNQKFFLLVVVILLGTDTNTQTFCTYTHGFYGNPGGHGCYNNSTIASSKQFMLNAFGTDRSVVFGSVAHRRFFTLSKTDITNNYIFEMLPGAKPGKAIGSDNVLPYDGAYYGDATTWNLVPIASTGPWTGRIENLLLANTIPLWFDLRINNSLGTISLAQDTLITSAQTSCGSGIPAGSPAKFGLPHDVIVYLNGGNGYSNNVKGLFSLANAVLGGIHSPVPISSLQQALQVVTQAFLECRIFVGSIPASGSNKNSEQIKEVDQTAQSLVTLEANPNPSVSNFTITILSREQNSTVGIKVFDLQGRTIEERSALPNSRITIGENYSDGMYIIKAIQGKYEQRIKLVKF